MMMPLSIKTRFLDRGVLHADAFDTAGGATRSLCGAVDIGD
jgi:hypothetical protein